MNPNPFETGAHALKIALYQPRIPQNTGNIIRLCANTGCSLHLVEPLGFTWDDRRLRRAGLDYHEFATVQRHRDLQALLLAQTGCRVLALTTHGCSACYDCDFRPDDLLLFGSEDAGLPADFRDSLPAAQRLRIPMRENSRSLNLANSVAVVVFEALRQLGFPHMR